MKIQKQNDKVNAIQTLLEMGAVKEKTEDRFGDTKSGWWLDGVYLAPSSDPIQALREVRGAS